MTEPFGTDYSAAYDTLYGDKRYDEEVAALRRVFATHHGTVSRILDLGCGTGGHALPLSALGFEVVGVDRSEPMLDVARAKDEHGRVRWLAGDIRDVDAGGRFDAVLMMFAVLGYQQSNEDALAALRTARRHLDTGGLVAFDVWFGPGVLAQRPEQRVRVLESGDGAVTVRRSSGTLRPAEQLCEVLLEVWRVSRDGVLHTEERHQMRYFFLRELELLLAATGFEAVQTTGFPESASEPDETTWSVLVVARAV